VSEPSGQLGAHSHVINKESPPAIASRDSDSLVAGALYISHLQRSKVASSSVGH